MHPKTSVSDAISNYYFQQQLPRTASLRTFHPSGKENVFIRNQNIAGKELKPIYNSKVPLQEIKTNPPTNISYLTHFKSESNLRPIQKTSISKVLSYACSLQKKELKEKRSDSAASHKKSVKFVQKIEDLQPVKSTLSHRSRSNSILKSRSTSKDPKNTYQVKQTLSSRIQIDHKNAAIKLRYRQILNQLGREVKLRVVSSIQNSTSIIVNKPIHTKYIDPSFPPLQTSISQASYLPRVSWKRISQISTLSSAIVRSKNNQTIITTIKYQREQCYSFCFMMKMIQKTPKIMDFLFQDLKFTEKGAYLIKIFQQTQWKYMIIDDYVPVQDQNGSPKQAFISIQFQNKPQIWPLLLHKAYAAYLGSYHKLHQITLNQLFTDLLRLPTQTFSLAETSINTLITTLLREIDQQIMIYAERRQPMEKGSIYEMINIKKNNQKISLFRQKDNQHMEISQTDLTRQYKQLTIIHIPNFETFSSIDIPIYSNIGRQIKNKYLINFANPPEITYEQFISKITLKSFSIEKKQRCTFIVKNYDRNQQTKTQNWYRVILLQKELDSYRWIAGKYSKDTISFIYSLQPGKYYLILIPDRKTQANLHFSIVSYTKNIPLSFQTQIEHNIATMIQKGCTDLAQRTGKMTQINKWICTYSLVHAESGLIIENINNQRRNGNIRIFRTIKNLKTKNCILLPLNKQFYLPNNPKVKDEAELIIQKEESASIVLLFFGGLDADFLKHFNFGL